jgi:predicted nuclease of predicted toxin-antitoxin system
VLKFAADENVGGRIVRQLLRRNPAIDIVRVQDIMAGAHDRIVLDWAAAEGRVLVTHDAKTMGPFAYERVAAGLPMPGVYIIRSGARLGRLIEDLLVIAECASDGEMEGQVRFLPL